MAQIDQAHPVVSLQALVVGSSNTSASDPCFLRLLSWMRAKLRAMTAAHPNSLAIWGGQDAKSVLERVARDKALV